MTHRTDFAVALFIMLAMLVPATPLAQSSDSPIDDFFASDDGDGGGILETASTWAETGYAIATGLRKRVTNTVTETVGLGDQADAETAADDLQQVANDNAAELQVYANDRVTADADFDVLKVDFSVDGETATLYIVADVVDGNYTNASVVKSTERTVDESCTLQGAAARSADDELKQFVNNYVDDDKNVSAALVSRVSSEYGGLIDCSFI